MKTLQLARTLSLTAWLALAPAWSQAGHPLDPLSRTEMENSVALLKSTGKLGENVSLVLLNALEPSKQSVLSWKEGAPSPRQALAVLYNLKTNQTFEATLDLRGNQLSHYQLREGVQPMQLEEDTSIGIEILKANPEWTKGLERRGIHSMDNVHMEMFVVGNPIGIRNPQKHRLLRGYPYHRVVGNNSFSEPIEGLSALIDLTSGSAQIRDNPAVIPLAGIQGNYLDPQQIGPLREPCKPLLTSMPQGPSFEIRGHEVSWQKWRFRFELHGRDGLVLHTVGYEDQGKLRPVMYRAGVSEVSVPYGGAGADWEWRSPLDEGEYGLGRLTTTLRPGYEVPDHATVLEAPYVNSLGKVAIKPGALAIWEEDGGILWEHHDDDANRTATRRGRQLVIGHMFTLGNYDYFTQYVFRQDGVIEARVTLNGDVLAQGVAHSECQNCKQQPDPQGNLATTGAERYGTLMAPHLVGVNHQHFFCFRLDMDVDGQNNSLYETNVRAVDDGQEVLGRNTFSMEKTLLRTEQDARRKQNGSSHRCWKVVNPTAPGYLGHLPGYTLEPTGGATPYSHPGSYNRLRASFLDHDLWATRYDPNEIYAAGDYPTSSAGGQGLSQWSGDASIENEDLVLWYTVGLTHIPRVEDWPIMPSATMGFRLVPEGFFKRNPSLDVPEPQSQKQ